MVNNKTFKKYGFNNIKELKQSLYETMQEGETFKGINQIKIDKADRLTVEFEVNKNPNKDYLPDVIPCVKRYELV